MSKSGGRLTIKQKTLAERVASHGNIARAQREAQYSDYGTAHKTLKLPHVAAYLQSLQDSATDSAGINLNRIAGELSAIGLANMADYYDEKGLISIDRLTRDAAAAIQELQITETASGAKSYKIKLHPKLDGLDKLTKMLGGYEAHNAQRSAGNAGTAMPVRDLARCLSFLLRKAEHDKDQPAPVTIDNDTGAVVSDSPE